MAIRRVRSFWLAAAASVLVVWAAAARRVPAASAQAAAPPNPRPNVVVVLVDDMGWSDIGPFRQRDRHAQSRRPRRARRAIHPVLCHAALLADARQPAHRAVFAPGGHGASRQRHPPRVARHHGTPQRSVRHDGRSAPRRGLLHRDVGQMAPWPGQRDPAVGSRLRTHAEPPRRRHVLSESALHRRRQPAREPRAGAAVSERRGDAARCARLRHELVRRRISGPSSASSSSTRRVRPTSRSSCIFRSTRRIFR